MADPRRNSNTRNPEAANAAIPRIRVLPANKDMLKLLRHPAKPQAFVEGHSMEWPLDQFTRRRIRDGDITIEEGQEDLLKLVSEHAVAADAERKEARLATASPNNAEADKTAQANADARADQPHTGNAPHVANAPGGGTNRAQRRETAHQNVVRDPQKPETA